MKRQRLFLGIGGGAIQLGLWSYYAGLSGMRIVIAEVDGGKVRSIRRNRNYCFLNIALFDRIVTRKVGPLEIYNPGVPRERERILDCIARANDIVTAVPSTLFYESGGIARLLCDGFAARPGSRPVMVYASENQIKAARLLEGMVFPRGTPSHVQFSDTVIARMGGPHRDRNLLARLNLRRLTPESEEALLVEDFSEIMIEKCRIPRVLGFETGFSRFRTTDNINVHEEQKLFGHNAVHSLLGFLAKLKGYEFMSDYAGDADFGRIGVDALRLETGRWFTRKFAGVENEMTAPENYESWVVQLCRRIVNPFLYDAVDRVTRDPDRKMGWSDRLAGIMRNDLSIGITPRRYALGIAAALMSHRRDGPPGCRTRISRREAIANLEKIWRQDGAYDKRQGRKMLALVGNGFDVIAGWKTSGQKSLYHYLERSGRLKDAGLTSD